MSVSFQAYGNNSPGTELELIPSAPIDPALFLITSLTSTQLNTSITFGGKVYDFLYTGTIDLSAAQGATPKNIAEASQYTVPNAITAFTISNAGQALFTETFSPAIDFDRVGYLLDNGTKMVAELAGNDVYRSSTTATGNNNDTVYLYAGNDTYYVNHALLTKVDLFYGGDGVDTAVYSQKAANYTIASTNSVWNYVSQTSNLPGFSVTDKTKAINTLYVNQVERLKFTDTNIALDIGKDQTAGSAYMLYKAAFNRTPDVGGLGFWISKMDTGMSYNTVAQNFVNSDEFRTAYGGSNPSVNTLVTKLYNNVLTRAPDGGGLAFWQDKLTTGGWTTANVLGYFATSAENVANVASLIANGIPYQESVG